MSEQEPTTNYQRLESEIAWYDTKSGSAQRNYKISQAVTYVSAALVPICALTGLEKITAGLGALIAIAEAAAHVGQWHHNWITYRSTCEALRHEKYTYLERADPYDIDSDTERRKLLVERTESLISTEHSKWIASQETAAKNVASDPRAAKAPN